ncbi:hypothetical protein KC326_g184 [Hortaea werneckii]|nr:hypothetical protein KC326_g184 [Hortaea werneckii]
MCALETTTRKKRPLLLVVSNNAATLAPHAKSSLEVAGAEILKLAYQSSIKPSKCPSLPMAFDADKSSTSGAGVPPDMTTSPSVSPADNLACLLAPAYRVDRSFVRPREPGFLNPVLFKIGVLPNTRHFRAYGRLLGLVLWDLPPNPDSHIACCCSLRPSDEPRASAQQAQSSTSSLHSLMLSSSSQIHTLLSLLHVANSVMPIQNDRKSPFVLLIVILVASRKPTREVDFRRLALAAPLFPSPPDTGTGVKTARCEDALAFAVRFPGATSDRAFMPARDGGLLLEVLQGVDTDGLVGTCCGDNGEGGFSVARGRREEGILCGTSFRERNRVLCCAISYGIEILKDEAVANYTMNGRPTPVEQGRVSFCILSNKQLSLPSLVCSPVVLPTEQKDNNSAIAMLYPDILITSIKEKSSPAGA